MKVILFDIDGTLIRSGGAGRDALDAALKTVFGRIGSDAVDVNGRTDRGIVSNLFRHHGIDDTLENWERFRAAYVQLLPECLRKRVGCVLPGVAALLEQLRECGTILGLLTGNVRDGARLKLAHYAIAEHFFPFGGFGDLHLDRNDVACEALAAAVSHAGRPVHADAVWVIGDTPWDIRCARHIGARVVAVATGTFSLDELAPYQPDLLLSDLRELPAL